MLSKEVMIVTDIWIKIRDRQKHTVIPDRWYVEDRYIERWDDIMN